MARERYPKLRTALRRRRSRYGTLNIDVNSARFIEREGVPNDAKVVGQTWQYPNKSGGPDKRFKNNRQIPTALYEEVP